MMNKSYNITKRSSCLLAVLILVCMAMATGLFADTYPYKPVQLIVTYSPGGATDFQARTVTMLASEEQALGQPIVILNKPGAGGRIGWNWFTTRTKADGYQLATYNVPHFIAQSIIFDTEYNIDNLEPIANWGADPAVLVVGKDSSLATVQDLVDYARLNPGRVTVSGAGLYVGHHIATLQLEKTARIKLTYIPTQGGVPALHLVMGGQVVAGFNNLSDAYRNRDRLKVLAVADLNRHEEFMPDVPTFKELGFLVDDSSVNFRGIMAPKGTPPHIIEFLAERIAQMFQHDKVAERMHTSGAPMRVMAREEVKKMWRERQVYLAELLAALQKE